MGDLFDMHAPTLAPETDDPDGWRLVRVAVERGVDRVRGAGDGTLTYKTREPIEVGRRVEVPLGRAGAAEGGIVVSVGGRELADGLPIERIKPVLRDTGAGLPDSLIRLARWMAQYYVCPLGMVLSTMLPAAVKHRTGLRRVTLIALGQSELDAGALTPAVRKAWESIAAIAPDEFPMAPADMMLRTGQRTMGPINKLVALGMLREVEAEDVRAYAAMPAQMSLEQHEDGGAGSGQARPVLTSEQAAVVDGVCASLGMFRVHLLRGVTGSGKTEVYLRVLERTLQAGGSGLVLVPEISLTPQTAGRFVERFRGDGGVGVAVLHSGLSASQRHKEWQRVASSSARVVVGARSAVFAPLSRLGLVVVDEEHASDYKQDQLPRYHARDAAIMRAQIEGCPVLLGSATPSLESWANAIGTPAGGAGKYALWELRERVSGGRLPHVEVVDLTAERRLRRDMKRHEPTDRQGRGGARGIDLAAHQHQIGPTLEAALVETLGAGGQALLLLNRRGYACYIACASQCGFVLGCEHCDTRMVQHRVIEGREPPKGLVRCHHCLAQTLPPTCCPTCGSGLAALGLGTQRVEEELKLKFGTLLGATPEEPRSPTSPCPGLLRVDGDTMKSARDYFDALARFAKGEIRVLLGTQMIAKGLDFPNVRLVGVINADTALGLPDFRAAERTFQLVSQVAGRAGRGVHAGRVIVQTMDPHAPPIEFASRHDYVGFASAELDARRAAGLPPAARMARIVFRDESMEKVDAHGAAIAKELQGMINRTPTGEPGVRVLGPTPCPIARIGGFHRREILLLSAARLSIQNLLGALRARGLLKSDARTAIDIDPIALA